MILSTGLDLCDIRRIEKILGRGTAARFRQRYFTPAENAHIAARQPHAQAAAYARRWAAKEAIAKALGTGFRGGLHMHQMEVLNDKNGKPTVELKGRALELLNNIISPPHPRLSAGRTRPAEPNPLPQGERESVGSNQNSSPAPGGRGQAVPDHWSGTKPGGGGTPNIHLAMTDEYPYAMAQIIISV